MSSYYMLVPTSAKKEDWKHKEKDSIDIQEFSMGRKGSMNIKGKHIKTTSTNKRVINGFSIVEIDTVIMENYFDEMKQSALDNGCQLLSNSEMRAYCIEHEPGEPV